MVLNSPTPKEYPGGPGLNNILSYISIFTECTILILILRYCAITARFEAGSVIREQLGHILHGLDEYLDS